MTTARDIVQWAERQTTGPIGPQLTYRSASEIEPSRPTWCWERWLCAGALHLLVGRQGQGKTTFAAWVIGQLTSSRAFPGDPANREPMTCALLSLEESADRLVARLRSAGADLERVLVLGDVEDVNDDGEPYRRPWRLPQDCSVLERFLADHGIALVVVDGLGYSVNGDTHNYGVIGSALSALASVAERTGSAVLGLTHPPKGGSDPVTAAIGSTAWTALARVVWLLGVDPDDDSKQRRVVQVAKSNYRYPDAGVAFVIGNDETLDVGYVTALGTSSVTAEALAAASVPAEERTEREEAREVVRSVLSDGPMETADLLKLTRAAGVSDRTVERARRDLGVKAAARRDSDTGKLLGWVLELPATTPPATPPRPLSDGVGGLGGVGVTSAFPETLLDQSAQSAQSASGGVAPFYDRDEF